MDSEALKLLAQGGLAAALLALIYMVGMKLVAAIDRLVDRFNDHTEQEAANHAAVREEIIGMRAEVNAALQWQERTPLELPPPPPMPPPPARQVQHRRTPTPPVVPIVRPKTGGR